MENFKLIGLKLKGKTKNQNGQSEKDCGELWQQFKVNKIAELIPNKISDSIYAVYYDYESDENGQYSYFLGCKVEENAQPPKELDEIIIPKQNYHKETVKGQMTGCISEAWARIWNSNINRKFGFDFEIYDDRSYDWNDAEIDIYLSVND